jgi:hypothetical protein
MTQDTTTGIAEKPSQSRAAAIKIIHDTMHSCLPEGAPLSFSDTVYASFTGKTTIIANVVMFDGQPATLHLKRWALGWSHGWDTLPGGACFLDDDNTWKRVGADHE